MSINTFIAFILAFGMFVGSILLNTDNPNLFFSLSSIFMVLGGTLASSFLGQEARYVFLALRGILSIFSVQRIGRDVLNREVGRIIRWGYLVQKQGMVALDTETSKVKNDEFLTFGIELVLSGYEGPQIRQNLQTMNDTTYGRNLIPAAILKQMAGAAPAFGMIGTLVGLIIMLSNMGGDPSALGSGLSVALLTTLYGVIVARMIFLPAAAKLTQREQINKFRRTILVEGLAMLADRKNPRYIQDRMNSFLDPAIRFDIDKQMKDK